WTDGRALVATGSPFADIVHGGLVHAIAQCNNAYVFPGVGLGVIAAGARRVSDEMFLAAAQVLAGFAPATWDPTGALLPPLAELRWISRQVALAVGAEAQRQGLAESTTPEELARRIDARRWEPRYLPLRYRAPAGS